MRPVRIYLSFLSNGDWEHIVYREIQALREAWSTLHASAAWEACAIHIGHDRPEYKTTEFESALVMQPKPVLATEAAKWGLPGNLSNCSDVPVGYCRFDGRDQPCGLYLVLSAWGYQFDGSKLKDTPKATLTPVFQFELEGWVKDFADKNPNAKPALLAAGIFDEISYCKNITNLDEQNSIKAGNFRFEYFIPQKDTGDPFAILPILPEWLLNCSISQMGFTVRLKNVCYNKNILTVRDLRNFTAEKLLSLPNMGRKSMRDLAASLMQAIKQHSNNPRMLTDCVDSVILFDHLQKTIDELPENVRQIITARLGAEGTKPQTLQTLGEMFGVTRERIRQIEKKYITSIIERETWDDTILKKISVLLSQRRTPLYLNMLAVEDNWFSGFEGKLEFLQEVIIRFSEEKVKVFTFEDRAIISTIDQNAFDALYRKIRDNLAKNIGSNYLKSRIEEYVAMECLGHGIPEMKELICESLFDSLHFANHAGREVLVGMGRGADNWVNKVLAEAEKPLHYSEIHERVNKIADKQLDIRRVHSCLHAIPESKLYGRGIYGLRSHLKIDPADAEEIIASVNEMISNGPEFKQWHAAELLQNLIEELPAAEHLTNYTLGIILEDSPNLICLGKQVWVNKSRDDLSTNDRIQMMNAIITVMEEAGGALKHKELIERVSRYRGFKSKQQQIQANERLIKLAPSLWGLTYRDLPFSPDEVNLYLDTIVKHIEDTQTGIHVSEIPGLLISAGVNYPPDQSPFVFLGLCSNDPRFKTWLGQLIGLAGWESARRESIASAFRKIWPTIISPISTLEMQSKLESILHRPLNRIKVSGLLCANDAVYDKNSETWTNPKFSDVPMHIRQMENEDSAYAISSAHGG